MNQPQTTGRAQYEVQANPKQAEAFQVLNDPETLVLLYGGAIRGGKTWFMFLALCTYALQYPKSRWAIVRKSIARIQDTTYPSWLAFLEETGLHYAIKEQTKTHFTFKNASQIFFFAESLHIDPELNRFRGLEVNGFGLEEINELSDKTLQKCIERAGTWFHSDAPAKILATCNPTDNWVKDTFYRPWKTGQLKKGCRFVPATINDNPRLPAGYGERLKDGLSQTNYARYVEADWDTAEENLIKSDWFQYISYQDLAQKPFFERMVWHGYLDGAYTDKTYNDPSGLLIAAEHQGTLYIRHAKSEHKDSADVLDWVHPTFQANGQTAVSLLKVEPKASGKTLVSLANRRTGADYLPAIEYQFPVSSKITPQSSKIERVSASTPFLMAGRVVLVNGPWNQDFVRECCNFPKGDHDDLVDCLTMAILQTIFKDQTTTIQVRR